MKGVKIKFSAGTFKRTSKVKLRQDIINSTMSSPEFRKEIRRVFQMANRRIQNIEKGNLLSPAVEALHKDDISSYSKFNMKHDTWAEIKLEYGKAVSFLSQPTSTASGTREYNHHLMKAFDLSQEEFDLMAAKLNAKMLSLQQSAFVEKYLMRYKDFTQDLEQSARDVSQQIESDAHRISQALDKQVEDAADAFLEMEDKTIKAITDAFKKFGM